jgi:dihydrofolate synthase/folylpolyglutamate synthase
LELVEQEPMLLLDGAHNPSAADSLADYLTAFRVSRPDARIILVVAMMRDKDHRGFLAPLRNLVSEVIVTEAGLARSAPADVLRKACAGWSQPIHQEPVPTEALLLAKRRASSRDLICVTGSLMLLGDIKAALRGCGLSPLRG